MRLLICAGGTGGGVYPALSVLQALTGEDERRDSGTQPQRRPAHEVLWVGAAGKMEADLVTRAGVPFEAIPAAGLHGVGLRALPGNLAQLARGFLAGRRILQRFQPDVLFFTGGYVAVPVALAGRNIPTALYVPDIEPGLALKLLARFADRIALTTETSRQFFASPAKLNVTGYPIRSDLKEWDRAEASQALGLAPDMPTLLVFGGSSGARSINRALLPALPALLQEMQVVHIAGRLDWEEVEKAGAQLSGELQGRYRAFPYLHQEMGAAFSAADLVLSRAGAATLGEFPAFGLPAILIPYPHAWRYQQTNAEYLAERGAAVIVADRDLPENILPVVRGMMNDPERREKMRRAMRSLARPQAARSIAGILDHLADRPPEKEVRRG